MSLTPERVPKVIRASIRGVRGDKLNFGYSIHAILGVSTGGRYINVLITKAMARKLARFLLAFAKS